jgi:hypothetical protein
MGFLDVNKLNRYIINNDYWLVDYNPTCLFIWSDYYKTEIAYDNEFAYIRLYIPKVGICYLPPLGNGNFKNAIYNIENDAKENGLDLIFTCIDEKNKEKLEKLGYQVYESISDHNYIYSASDLAFYEGKKLKAKRNLVNKFEKLNPNVFYRQIKKEDLPRIIEFVEDWRISNDRQLDDSYYLQLNVIKKLIEYLYELNIIGVMLEDGQKIYGIALGSVLGNMAYEHIELALVDYKGAYQEVLQCFARIVSLKCRYINREEDMGIEALRESKLSYNPIKLEKFYTTINK